MDLNHLWFALLGVLLTGYAILDGFDLGVGILHLLVRDDRERRIFMNSIGPLWDGNEVWLVTFGGAPVRGLPARLRHRVLRVLPGLHAAAVRADLAGGVDGVPQQAGIAGLAAASLTSCFFGASTLATFLFGVAIGNAMKGMPVGARRWSTTARSSTCSAPYPILVGLFTVSLFAMHGVDLPLPQDRGRTAATHSRLDVDDVLRVPACCTLVTLDRVDLSPFPRPPTTSGTTRGAWAIVVLNVLAMANIPRAIYQTGRATRFSRPAARSRRWCSSSGWRCSEPHRVEPRPGVQPDALQRRVVAEDAGHHGHHRGAGYAVRADLHRDHLLGVPRQGGAGAVQLLTRRARRGAPLRRGKERAWPGVRCDGSSSSWDYPSCSSRR